MKHDTGKDNGWSKKTPLYFNIGMIVSLAIVLTAFEWSSPAGVPEVFTAQNTGLFEETQEVFVIPNTPPPPVKVITNPQIEIVKDDAKIEEENAKIITDFDEGDKIDVPADVPIKEQVQELEIETPETIFTVVESAAEPEGGFQAFYKYIGETMKYPKQARRMGIEGKVLHLQFWFWCGWIPIC